MSSAERQRRHRAKRQNGGVAVNSESGESAREPRASLVTPGEPHHLIEQDLLLLDAESLAGLIVAGCSPEKADKVAKSINARLLTWRVGSHALLLQPSAAVPSYCADEAAAAGLPGPRTRRASPPE